LIEQARRQQSLGAMTHLGAEGALAAAVAADKMRVAGHDLPLLGVPLVVKDNIDVAGMPTTAGTAALRGHLPARSAPCVERLVAAGAIVLGKSAMHELAYGITGNNAAFGPTRNPFDPSRIAGGSSGGTAAAIAAGLAPAGLGSDTGGSIRIPAALCGLAGLRPTSGRYPSDGIVRISTTRDTVGPIARSCADLELLDGVIAGTAAMSAIEPDHAGLRLGVSTAYFLDNADAETSRLFEAALDRLEATGVQLIEIDDREIGTLTQRGGFPVTLYETPAAVDDYLRQHQSPLSFRDIALGAESPDVRDILLRILEAPITLADYREAMDGVRPRLLSAYAELFTGKGLAGLVFPTTLLPAAPLGDDVTTPLNGKPVDTFTSFIHNTAPGSLAGVPGLTLPMGCTTNGLPVGFAIDSPLWSDRLLLALGRRIEAVLAPND
jgi:mandelamide amidase